MCANIIENVIHRIKSKLKGQNNPLKIESPIFMTAGEIGKIK
jgi:hypothetical protein